MPRTFHPLLRVREAKVLDVIKNAKDADTRKKYREEYEMMRRYRGDEIKLNHLVGP